MLYLIATPIGNLEDITLRALSTLKLCDYILCEDTRHSAILLNHYGIRRPLKSFHKFNEKARENPLLEDLRKGKNIALISDAGTPGICDPGESLVQACRKENIPVTSLPGPCAFAVALSLSTFPKDKVQFLNFLPKKTTELRYTLAQMLSYDGLSVAYDTPHHITTTLQMIIQMEQGRKVALLRELTKLHEEFLEGTAEELLHLLTKPKGEMVLLIEGSPLKFDTLSIEAHVRLLQKQYGLSPAEAIKTAAVLRGISKREVYGVVNSSS